MKWYQFAVLALQLLSLIHGIHSACEGSSGQKASGFKGVMIAFFAQLFVAWLLWKAGAFSEWIP